MRSLGVLAPAAALAGALLPASAHAAAQYNLTLTNSGLAAEFFGIGSTGDVIGDGIEPGAATSQGFVLTPGSTRVAFLGSPGDPNNTHSFSSPEGVNSGGDVVGTSTDFNTGIQSAIEWDANGTPTNLGNLPTIANNYANPDLTAINDNGVIVGFGRSLHGDTGFEISGTQVTQLPVLPAGGVDAEPLAINNNGVSVGWADNSQKTVAVQWKNNAIKQLGGLPGSFDSQAFAVNNKGQAVGGSLDATDFDVHAVLFSGGKVTDLDVPGTGVGDAQANAINDNGVIVGEGGNGDAFIYQNGQATDLNQLLPPGSAVTLIDATGINNSGDIVGTAVSNDGSGQTYGFELTPVS